MIEGVEVTSEVGVVAANPPAAAAIGARVLEAGGNAMDAAVAASFACCMLRPNQTGVGGYVCSALVRSAEGQPIFSIDANGVAPAAAHERMFDIQPMSWANGWLNEGEYSCSVPGNANIVGPLAVSAPGMMAGMGIIHERWGKLPWARIIEPSLALLEQGFPYEEVSDAIRNGEKNLRRFEATAAHLMPEGKVPGPQDRWHRREMEKTLARVAAAGWRDFYDGQIGRAIADHVQALGGILTRADMASYQPRVTEPYVVTYRDATVHGAILPNGCISTLQTLQMLECLDFPKEDSPRYFHLLGEVLKLAWRDRIQWLADPDFSPVPIARLLSKDYNAGRVETLRLFPDQVDRFVPPADTDGPNGTLHVSAADARGGLASMTISQGMSFGSCVTVPGWGIILGHGMCRLDPRPGRVNSIAPGKRPLNNTSPLLLTSPTRDAALGLPGGRIIISVMPRAVQLMVDRGWTGHQASIAPRLHVEMNEPLSMTTNAGPALMDGVRALGHEVKEAGALAGVLNVAEFLRESRATRGGSAVSAAGAE
ncbi:MAG: gamma-glutamyltransferase [Planctomycetota bacterium]|nr:gamma-glutamyltransferase [Planctomycetota bacterium]